MVRGVFFFQKSAPGESQHAMKKMQQYCNDRFENYSLAAPHTHCMYITTKRTGDDLLVAGKTRKKSI